MRHLPDGTLRRLVDEPASVTDADHTHLAACATCRDGLQSARDDAARAATALGTAGEAPDVDRAWARFSTAADDGAPARTSRTLSPWRAAIRKPVVAAVGVGVVLVGAGAAAAADWLPIFRTEQIEPVTVTEADLEGLPELSAYGDLELLEGEEPREVPDAAAAAEASGLDVPEVTELPRGVTGDPTYQVMDDVTAVFTFSAEDAAQAAEAAGGTAPPPPAGLDGSEFRLTAGPGVAAVWSEARGIPTLAVARGVAPSVDSSGVPFATVSEYLLSLPGVPDGLAEQLRTFEDGTTLPLPLPADMLESTDTDVDGTPATLLTSSDGTMAAVVWVQDGVVTVVAGTLSTDEVLAVAHGLE